MDEISEVHIGQRILEHAGSYPDAPCVEFEGRVTTRFEFVARASTLRKLLLRFGIAKGDTVAILCTTAGRGLECALALWDLRARVVFLDPRQSAADMSAICDAAQVKFKFSDLPTFQRRSDFEAIPRDIAPSETLLSFSACRPEDDAIVFTSSGTTGVPKVRGVTHSRLAVGIANLETTIGLGAELSLFRLMIGNLSFSAMSFAWIRWLFLGAPIIDLFSFYLTKDVYKNLSREDLGVASLSPAALRELINYHVVDLKSRIEPAFPHLKQLRTVGGPVSGRDLRRAFEILTPNIESSYSLSGIGPISRLSGGEALQKGGSVGRPFDSIVVRIIGPNGQATPAGGIGHVFAKNTLHPNAVEIETGDLGYIDEDGFLFLTGRTEQNAIRHSININLADLESDIRSLQGISDCIAFAIADPETGDDVVFLAVESEISRTVVRTLIRRSLSSYRRPDRIYVRRKLPRNAAEKISLRELKALVEVSGDTFVSF
ncbi:Acyl-CoA synthetase (AMP-forming)/AMP-acid ligase II [Cognatiyoonia sediminum]|uniref:Acyl-CoA synthetase (AMP-forming)/AMP-acid ligase II n=1 Tax=Cognatiyoonia sediminum TaxID=1508389 RepID=A0A1M5QSG5_9RHOB|nr:class I adenylate-forming enzyme family protein [Cognatiyoonia sediminum]SHH16841.1 Acyl-CoA synthetase (AMP-forming)/AMP-acid ligase II [Cognatiyoonia sediminum]